MENQIYDIAVIGGGPVGLFAGALAAESGAKCVIVESRCQLGGIMMAVYPDKNVYNFPGIPAIRGRDLIAGLLEKTRQYNVDKRPAECVDHVAYADDLWAIKSNRDNYRARAILMTTGIKAHYSPMIDYIDIRNWSGHGIYETWPSLEELNGKSVAVLCGNPSELVLPDELGFGIKDLTVICDDQVSSIDEVGIIAPAGMKISIIRRPWRIQKIAGDGDPENVLLLNEDSSETKTIQSDLVVGFYQSHSRQTLFSSWGIEMLGQHIKVDQRMQTNVKRIYAAGDIAWYPGKIKLLSAGIEEVKIAVKNMLKDIRRAAGNFDLKGRQNG